MKRIVLALALMVSAVATSHAQDAPEEIPQEGDSESAIEENLPEGDVGKYVLIPKAGGRDWAIMLDTQTGRTWRLGHLQPGTVEGKPGDRWYWMPIGVCADCR